MFLLRPLRFLANALTAECSSRQLALGLALGVAVGLVPKGNLIAVALMVMLCASRVNLGAGLLSAFLFSWIGMAVDPLSHELGLWLLTIDSLQPMWTSLYDLPVVPWTSFNNSVVLGSLLIGLIAIIPVYLVSEPLCARYTPPLGARLRKLKVVQALHGAEWAGKLGKV